MQCDEFKPHTSRKRILYHAFLYDLEFVQLMATRISEPVCLSIKLLHCKIVEILFNFDNVSARTVFIDAPWVSVKILWFNYVTTVLIGEVMCAIVVLPRRHHHVNSLIQPCAELKSTISVKTK